MCDQCCPEKKSIGITYSRYVFVSLGIQHAMRISHIVICGLPRSTIIFFHIISNGTILKKKYIYPLKPKLNPICYLLALLGAHHFLHVSRIRVKSLTFRRLMSYIYIYMEHPFLMFLDHTQRRSTVGRTPLDE